jgi:hypothetical protein
VSSRYVCGGFCRRTFSPHFPFTSHDPMVSLCNLHLIRDSGCCGPIAASSPSKVPPLTPGVLSRHVEYSIDHSFRFQVYASQKQVERSRQSGGSQSQSQPRILERLSGMQFAENNETQSPCWSSFSPMTLPYHLAGTPLLVGSDSRFSISHQPLILVKRQNVRIRSIFWPHLCPHSHQI